MSSICQHQLHQGSENNEKPAHENRARRARTTDCARGQRVAHGRISMGDGMRTAAQWAAAGVAAVLLPWVAPAARNGPKNNQFENQKGLRSCRPAARTRPKPGVVRSRQDPTQRLERPQSCWRATWHPQGVVESSAHAIDFQLKIRQRHAPADFSPHLLV